MIDRKQSNDLARLTPPSIILSGNFGSPGNTAKESRGAHGSRDGRIAAVVSEKEEAIPKFDLGNVFAKIDSPLHPHTSCGESERNDNGLTFDKGKDNSRPVSGQVA